MPLNTMKLNTMQLKPVQLNPTQLNPTQVNTDLQVNSLAGFSPTLDLHPDLLVPDLQVKMAAVSWVQTSSQQSLYSSERSFTAAKYEEAVWDRLLPGDAEGYRFHLAVEISKMREFRTGVVAVKRGGIVVCLAPYFVAEQAIVSASANPAWSALHLPVFPVIAEPVMTDKAPCTRMVCVGSPVTSHGKLGINQDYPLDAGMIAALNEQLELIARREGISTIAYKDMASSQAQQLGLILQDTGFIQLNSNPLLHHTVCQHAIEEHLSQLDEPRREQLQNALQISPRLQVDVTAGLPENMAALYTLYENSHQRNADGTPKLSPEFFESVAALMPNNCRFVQYRWPDSPDGCAGRLIGFSMLLYRDGIAIEKCRAISSIDDCSASNAASPNTMPLNSSIPSDHSLLSMMWLHNLQLCMHDGMQGYRHQYRGDALEQAFVDGGIAELQTSHSYFRQLSSTSLDRA